ncbi:hypothetical protein Trco_004584 [Trichoderma cornu-damae]|uniref:Enoyl reductase (ER) domain-containing protein n=1 Tax=Trichoderma cornu-damae TaxID=654480 RepID=A0A9P8TUA9_9HYPO|nr:hypothetical protein Trco_004584 [Trichoderma cornu-damae]
MATPETYKTYHRTTGALPLTIVQSTVAAPKALGANHVLIKIHSISLNYRDGAMLHGAYPWPTKDNGVPGSDCSAEVVAVGSEVHKFKVGDHVSPGFCTNYLTGDELEPIRALGGDQDGVLAEYAVFPEQNLVRLPEYLSWDEASTLACAGVTSWNSIGGLKGLSPESSYVLLEGTGGVSMVSLLLLVDAGIKTIITSSSDAKIAQIQKLSPLITGVNYKTNPDINAEVQRITNGRGVDVVVNTIGITSLVSNINCLCFGGSISVVGILGGLTAEWNPSELLKLTYKRAVIRGIAIGSRVDFEDLCAHLAERKIRLQPLVDRTFAFDEAKEAIDYMWAGRHVGKVIVKAAE